MPEYLEVALEDGSSLKIEVEPTHPTGVVPAARPEELVVKAKGIFDSAMQTIKATANEFVKEIKALDLAPDQVEVQFGVKIDAEVGAMVAKTGAEAHYIITFMWQRTTLEHLNTKP